MRWPKPGSRPSRASSSTAAASPPSNTQNTRSSTGSASTTMKDFTKHSTTCRPQSTRPSTTDRLSRQTTPQWWPPPNSASNRPRVDQLRELRPPSERPAQRTGYRPGQVLQLDWAELPTRPRIKGRERRVYALVGALPYSGSQTAHFSFDMTLESFLEGHVRIFDWLGGVVRECVYDNLRSVVAKRDSRQVVRWNRRFL